MKLSAIHLPTARHIERIETMTAETEASTCGVIGQRKNRRHTPVAIENLHALSALLNIGPSIAVHSNRGRTAAVRPGGNIEVVECLSGVDSSVGPDTVAQAGTREALGDK